MKWQRTLAPSAAPLGWMDIIAGVGGLFSPKRTRERLEGEFREMFGVRHVFFVSSGKAALLTILRALQRLSSRRKVVLPGYTCFSVPSAVVRAGLTVELCDVDTGTLDFDWPRLSCLVDSDTLCVVPTHLYGSVADIGHTREICRPSGVFVVEDAAQALGAKSNGGFAGTLGDVAFFSFGRGKNVSCGSGGAILTSDERIAQAVAAEYRQLPKETVLGVLKNLLAVVLMQVFIRPALYWFPAGLPFLKLGETRFEKDFPALRMDPVRAGLLRTWKARLRSSTSVRLAHGEYCARRLGEAGVTVVKPPDRASGVYLRLPVLLRSDQEKVAVCELSKQKGLGVSGSYPTSLGDVPELQGLCRSRDVAQSNELAHRLVTVPTHPWLTDDDLDRICKLFEDVQAEPARASVPNSDHESDAVVGFGLSRVSSRAGATAGEEAVAKHGSR